MVVFRRRDDGKRVRRATALMTSAMLLVACATTNSADKPTVTEEFWSAYGFMASGPIGDGQLIGTFFGKEACDAAAQEWMSTQVAGNPVYAECFPPDLD